MFTLYKKELNYYLNNPIGYIILVLFGVFANFLYVKDIFVVGSASMRPFFNVLPWLLLIFVPALAMRALSEEKRTNTIEVLLTLPVSETQVVVAKFLALSTVMCIGLALTLSLPISLAFLTKMYFPEVMVGYLGTILLALFFLSICLFFSAQTKNQVVSFLMSVVVLFVCIVLGSDFMASVLPRSVLDMLTYFTPLYHLQNFVKGVVDLRSLFYFVSATFVFMFLTVIQLEKRG